MTMLKSLTTAAFAGSALLAASAASAATVDVSTTAETVAVGDTFEVRLNFSADESDEFLFDALFDFAFDGELFDFVSADFTDPATGLNQLDLPNDPNDFGFFSDVEQVSDSILSVSATSGNSGAFLQEQQADDFTVVTLTFVADMVGTGDLGLGDLVALLAFDDPDFSNQVETAILDAFVTVTVSEVPLPGAAVFLLTGAAGLFARRRMAA